MRLFASAIACAAAELRERAAESARWFYEEARMRSLRLCLLPRAMLRLRRPRLYAEPRHRGAPFISPSCPSACRPPRPSRAQARHHELDMRRGPSARYASISRAYSLQPCFPEHCHAYDTPPYYFAAFSALFDVFITSRHVVFSFMIPYAALLLAFEAQVRAICAAH